ncbi:S-adenosylmethionine:tRNA ribosyltransferase-isomerase, partial [Bacteroidales bacterium OttesenSCG-928-M11]|nr:S-adenosylmethionine:tRNA ribosyltransferase-isomerase [Bacteroidales bacterium OttesenSCG-928-M11]
MSEVKEINIEFYNYDLPDSRIAKFPLKKRDESKLLIYRDNLITESSFHNLAEYIPEGSILVFNNTKVIQARIIFRKETGAQIEIFCLEPKLPTDYALSFSQKESCSWICLIGNAKRWKTGRLSYPLPDGKSTLYAERLESYGESSLVRFEWDNQNLSFAEILEIAGELPIPPYLNRKTEECDKETYQTVYSKINGSVAAPTAGLHFTKGVFDSLEKKQVKLQELTLHVGAGTFKPVKSETLAEHDMHTECFTVSKELLRLLIKKEGKLIAVGTTSVRSLESLYYLGLSLESNPDSLPEEMKVNQWDPYTQTTSTISATKALQNLLDYMEKRNLESLTTHTQILIAPSYEFKIVNAIITNFHQPKSTLLLLISAFVKGKWKTIYDYALDHNFRF